MASKASKNVSYVVQSKVKELVKKSKMKCSSDVIDAMNRVVAQHIQKGVERAKANGRKTLRAADL
jgi:histone H3/H4